MGRLGKYLKLGLVVVALALAIAAIAACGEEEEAETTVVNRLAAVKERGTLICASRNDVPGYGSLDAAGRNVGFDIDLCRAVATAVLGDPEAIQINYITAAERGPTIQSGEVDLLVRTVTWTTSRDAQWGNYVHTTFYDGQGFMVPRNLGVSSALELCSKTRTWCLMPTRKASAMSSPTTARSWPRSAAPCRTRRTT